MLFFNVLRGGKPVFSKIFIWCVMPLPYDNVTTQTLRISGIVCLTCSELCLTRIKPFLYILVYNRHHNFIWKLLKGLWISSLFMTYHKTDQGMCVWICLCVYMCIVIVVGHITWKYASSIKLCLLFCIFFVIWLYGTIWLVMVVLRPFIYIASQSFQLQKQRIFLMNLIWFSV